MKPTQLCDVAKQLRKTMQKVPSPVVVVTCNSNKVIRGITCSSFNSISLNPPIVSFALKIPSATRDILLESSRYAIHILSVNQMKHSTNFASPKTQGQFNLFPFYLNSDGLPIFHGCLSVLLCALEKRQMIGDHEVWYSRVLQVSDGYKKDQSEYKSLEPLLYYNSTYRSIGDEKFIESFENVSLNFNEWTHRAHLRMAWIYMRNSRGESNTPMNASSAEIFGIIKSGIIQYNKANQELVSHPFNETITSFFFTLIGIALRHEITLGAIDRDFVEFLELYPFLDQYSFIYKYYSKETLYSEESKLRLLTFTRFVPPDLQIMPTSILNINLNWKEYTQAKK